MANKSPLNPNVDYSGLVHGHSFEGMEADHCPTCKMFIDTNETVHTPPLEVDKTDFGIRIAMPTTKVMVWQQQVHSLVQNAMDLRAYFPNMDCFWDGDSDLCIAPIRNRLVERFLADPKADILIFLDYDMVFHPKLLPTIVNALHKADDIMVYGGLYHARRFPYQPFVTDIYGQWLDGSYPKGPMRTLRFGTGALGIKKEVFKSLQKPYFKLQYTPDGHLIESEDCYFGHQLETVGISAYVDSEILSQHLQIIQIPLFFQGTNIHCDGIKQAYGGLVNQERHI